MRDTHRGACPSQLHAQPSLLTAPSHAARTGPTRSPPPRSSRSDHRGPAWKAQGGLALWEAGEAGPVAAQFWAGAQLPHTPCDPSGDLVGLGSAWSESKLLGSPGWGRGAVPLRRVPTGHSGLPVSGAGQQRSSGMKVLSPHTNPDRSSCRLRLTGLQAERVAFMEGTARVPQTREGPPPLLDPMSLATGPCPSWTALVWQVVETQRWATRGRGAPCEAAAGPGPLTWVGPLPAVAGPGTAVQLRPGVRQPAERQGWWPSSDPAAGGRPSADPLSWRGGAGPQTSGRWRPWSRGPRLSCRPGALSRVKGST